MILFSTLWKEYRNYYSHSRPILQSAGMTGAVAFPLFYLLNVFRDTQSFDSLGLRVVATLLCLCLALKDRWPEGAKPYYLAFSYLTFFYCLPFFFFFTSLKNDGGVVSVGNTLMSVFFLILLTDWRNTIAMLVGGGALATAAYLLTTPDPSMPVDYFGRLPMLILIVVGGSLFKFTQRQIQAERVDAATALAGSIAHEMRNPLGQLRHNLESMHRALPLPTTTTQVLNLDVRQLNELYRHLAQSELAVQRGLQVIAMTLDEVSAKELGPDGFSCLSAAEVTDKAIQEYGYETEEARSRVLLEVREDFSFSGDETSFVFVLFNLIKNALFYMPLSPQVRVHITIQDNQVRVRDTGPGIAPDVLRHLFEPFRTAGKSGGSGLGLAYCQRVMTSFGGSIRCDSVQGEFTEFTLTFPVLSAQEQEAHRLAVLGRAQAAFSGKRILIVDDDAMLRLTTRHKLQPLGAEVDEAANGARAMEMLARQHYDLVVLDLNMPVLDGYAVAQRIRQGQVPANRDVCIVACTSEPAHLARVKTQKAGMDGFVGKPFDQLTFVQTLHHALTHPVHRQPSMALVGRKVLLADDNAHNRQAVAAYLARAGVNLVEVGHGEAVLSQVQSTEDWDLILMDINMPGLNGLDTTRAIRRRGNADAPRVPIIALTAHADQDTMDAARAAGMDDFLIKPVDAPTLYEVLARHLAGGENAAFTAMAGQQAAASGAAIETLQLLNFERLESYKRIDLLEVSMPVYLEQVAELIDKLDGCLARNDFQDARELMHSLLGISGEAGAVALHRLVRRCYVPMVAEGRWPQEADWLGQIRALAHRSDEALRAYVRSQARAESVRV
ncbi:MAG: hybrid sensor histidine kinase/response regulator [Burkholderiaceae bacterium]|nr:hybrid sensor histidine kinase/response regulator [Burkholderiaceae bacterium]MDO9090211.1 hybrid sensor histidine kinase/response regulator [Burkholderiaceae bacterium]